MDDILRRGLQPRNILYSREQYPYGNRLSVGPQQQTIFPIQSHYLFRGLLVSRRNHTAGRRCNSKLEPINNYGIINPAPSKSFTLATRYEVSLEGAG